MGIDHMETFAKSTIGGFEEHSRVLAQRVAKQVAYLERNKLVALLTSMYHSGIRKTDIEGWNPKWHNCVYIDLPTGQVSWHYHDDHAFMFSHLPPYDKPYDGHTTEEKWVRVANLRGQLSNHVQQTQTTVSKFDSDSRCNYLAARGSICNKCGRVHDGNLKVPHSTTGVEVHPTGRT